MPPPFARHMPALGNENKVSGADRKKMRRVLLQMFPLLTETDIEVLLPLKGADVASVKLAAPRREVIYTVDAQPVMVDLSGKGDWVPTVMGLWKAPSWLPIVYVKHPAVTTYLVAGADLMLPGVHLPPEGLPVFEKGQLLAVCVYGQPLPVAVGTAGMASSEVLSRTGGKLVEVIQAYGDKLWEHGGKAVPNDGFLANAVVPVGLGSAGLDRTGYQEDDSGQPILEPGGAAAPDSAATQEVQQEMDGLALQGTGTCPAEEAAEPVDMDALLLTSLLQALHKSIKDNQLPLTSSVLWAQHILPCRPAGSTLDIKKCKSKTKLSSWLKTYAGKKGMLTLKEDRHSGDQVLTNVDRTHALYTDFRPYRHTLTAAGASLAAAEAVATVGTETATVTTSTTGGAQAGGAQAGSELVIEELWRPGKELHPLFDALGQPHDVLLTEKEVGVLGFAYVAAAGLKPQRVETILLNVVLCDALFKGLVKKGEPYPTHLPAADLRESILRRCKAETRIQRGQSVSIKKGAAPVLSVNVVKRQGHKVTCLTGSEAFQVDPEQLAGALRQRFASSCTVNELPGKNAGHEVVVQGNITEHVEAFLADRYGVSKRYIHVKDLK